MYKHLLFAFLFGFILMTQTGFAQTVTLDYYFNHEVRQDEQGRTVRYHYLWEDTASTGFSVLGAAFRNNGATLKSLNAAPSAKNLKGTDIYIIVDPDTKKENPHPHYIEEKDVTAIAKWVKAGGLLVMLANDSANVELAHFNTLAKKFGLNFNNDLQNHVIDDQHFQDGAITITDTLVFKQAHKIFIKDAASITVTTPAITVVNNDENAVIIAVTQYGKGTVVAVGDPWLYNEYTNGRLPADFDNNKAANDLAQWLVNRIKH